MGAGDRSSDTWGRTHERATWVVAGIGRDAGVAVTAAAAVPAEAVERCGGQRATIVRGDADNRIRGTRGRDVIVAGAGDDKVIGRGGRDIVCGGPGQDRLHGGFGNDRIIGGLDDIDTGVAGGLLLRGDHLHGGPGDDRLVPVFDARAHDRRVTRDALHWGTSAHRVLVDVARGVATGQGRDTFPTVLMQVAGSHHGDVLLGSALDDELNGLHGSDMVRGRGGDDAILLNSFDQKASVADTGYGGAGDDVLQGWRGPQQLVGGDGDDSFHDPDAGPDRLFGGRGSDRFHAPVARSGAQVFAGGSGGGDFLFLDTNMLNPTNRHVTGTFDLTTGSLTFADLSYPRLVSGFEHVQLATQTENVRWQVHGTPGPDRVDAGGTVDGTAFEGLDGDDEFWGGEGDDHFDGGPGDDLGHRMGSSDSTDTCVSVERFDDPAQPVCPSPPPVADDTDQPN
jgi:Ca2+-binding RTX toxin-like protein